MGKSEKFSDLNTIIGEYIVSNYNARPLAELKLLQGNLAQVPIIIPEIGSENNWQKFYSSAQLCLNNPKHSLSSVLQNVFNIERHDDVNALKKIIALPYIQLKLEYRGNDDELRKRIESNPQGFFLPNEKDPTVKQLKNNLSKNFVCFTYEMMKKRQYLEIRLSTGDENTLL